MAPRHLFVVLTAPTEGMEDEFNDWYDNRHLSDVLQLDDYVAARRYRFVPKEPGEEPLRPYLALYWTQTDDVAATQRRLVEVAGTDAMPFAEAIDQSQSIGWYYEQISHPRGNGATPADARLFVVLTAPADGKEDEYNAWYEQQHVGDVLALGPYVSARRYRFAPWGPAAQPLRPYLALYDVVGDVVDAQRRLVEVATTEVMPYTDAIDRSQSIGWYYEPITERRTA